MNKCICEECFEIVASVFWSHKDLLLCENCKLGQGIETEITPEKRELLKSQREHFEKWKVEN